MDHLSVPHHIRALTTEGKSNEKKSNNEPVSAKSIIVPVASIPANESSSSTITATETGKTACKKLQDPISPTEIESDLDEPSVDDQPNLSAYKKQSTPLQSGIEGYINVSKPDFEAKMLEMVEIISRKVDRLSISSGSSAQAGLSSSGSTPSDEFSKQMKESYGKMKEWKNVKNLVELVTNIQCLALYPLPVDDMDIFKDGGAILRCETCFTLHKDKANKLTAARAARKLSSDCFSICTGKYLNPDCMTEMMSGKGDNWRRLKSRVLQHMICATDGQTHFKALTLLNEDATLKKKHYEAAETLLKCAVSAVKTKSAALHFESQVAFAFSVGGQVGQCGHSRKLFSDHLKCLLAVIKQQTKEKLSKSLASTGLPPHFYMTVDKATVNKRSNQAVLICPILDGKRVPIAVAAPEVYTSKADGSVEGGSLSHSATQALEITENAYGKDIVDSLIGMYIIKPVRYL